MAELNADSDAIMPAFIAGWFAHARNPRDAPLLPEDAWHAYRLIESTSGQRVPVGPAWNGVSRAWVIKTLTGHRLTVGRCTCGWPIPPNAPMLPAHETHVAEVLIPRESKESGDV